MLLMSVIASCSEDKELVKIINPEDVNAPSITEPIAGDQFVLSSDEQSETAMIIRWDEPDFGVDIKIEYSVDIDVNDGDFTNAINLALTTEDTLAITHSELNAKLLELGLSAGDMSNFDIRITSTVNDQIDDDFSEIVTVGATPYSTVFPSIYMIGVAVGGWDTVLAVEVASTGETNEYYTKAYFDAAGDANFRFFSAADWGSSLGGWDIFTTYPTDLLQPKDGDGDPNFQFIGTTGWYEISVDKNTSTIEMKATTEPLLYLTGDATHGWNFDTPTTMTWVGHEIWEGDVTFTQNNYFRIFEQADWGPTGYGYDVLTNYDEDYIIIADGHSDPNWQFIGASGSYHVIVDKRNESIVITENN